MEKSKPAFNARVLKATGAGEQVEVVFAAADAGELRTRLKTAVTVVTERMKSNNDEILDMSAVVESKIQALRTVIRREERAKLGLDPEGEEANGAAAAGATDLRANP